MSEACCLRFSVVIPTYQRRDLAVAAVAALARQDFSGLFEVIVVVDGSHDGTVEALNKIETSFPLTVRAQSNQGAAAARNHGARLARGEILLFLDDDMEAHPKLLAEHDRSHRTGADVVLGHMPLHPCSPRNVLSSAVGEWAEDRARILAKADAELTLHDLLTGQISISREVFDQIGGFDTRFTEGGTFGNEDIDFGVRLLKANHLVVFNRSAISYQRYVVGPRQHLRQWREAGRADVVLARKHPREGQLVFAANGAHSAASRWLYRPLQRIGFLTLPLLAALRALAAAAVKRAPRDRLTASFFFTVRALHYWRGVHEAGGIPSSPALRVLAYHAITDLAGDPVLAPYGVPPRLFRLQIETLLRHGYRFVTPDQFSSFLEGKSHPPKRALLLTFDDCFEDLLHVALPILQECGGVPAIAFAVSSRIGGTNEWDATITTPRLRLLDARGLRRLESEGIEIGAHSRTHPYLTHLGEELLAEEVDGSMSDLEDAGLRRPRFLAYPYGESNLRVERAARAAGFRGAFTVRPGSVRQDSDPFSLPRIEILRRDGRLSFLWKVILATPPPVLLRRCESVLRHRSRYLSAWLD
jgi:peptidoglycan/xylan/chitin deacetylase (PgdA/CDA1 family)/glycosyltransferase involved in cell wall biosynthesis